MDIDFTLQREKMVDGQIRTTDVHDVRLIDAMSDVPREDFVPARKRSLAYIDEDLEIAAAGDAGPARYLMEPSPFAKLVQLAGIGPGDFVLDIGCGTGYSSAILSCLASSVIALESDASLAGTSSELLESLSFDNVVVVEGALEQGYPDQAPYDVIFVGGAVDAVPDALFRQLRNGGRLVAVVGQGNAGVARLFVKDDDGHVSGRRVFNAAVKRLPGFEAAPAFEF